MSQSMTREDCIRNAGRVLAQAALRIATDDALWLKRKALPVQVPRDPDLDFAGGDLPDDDPDVIAGMARLAALRKLENQVPEVRP